MTQESNIEIPKGPWNVCNNIPKEVTWPMSLIVKEAETEHYARQRAAKMEEWDKTNTPSLQVGITYKKDQ